MRWKEIGMQLKDKIFLNEPRNTSRQWELDLARTVIIFCLGIVHVIIESTTDEGLCSGIPYLFDTIIGGPFGAPMFMFVMGVGMCFTIKNSPKDFFVKGAIRFAFGYVLNICRFLIPYSIGYWITGDYATYVEPLLYKVLCNDILTFAGLSMMIMALFMKLKLSKPVMMIVAAVMCGFGTLLNGVDVQSPLGNIFLGYFIGTEDAAGMVLSYFPVLNWMIFPVFGYVFGSVLKYVKDKKLFYLTFSLPAAIIAVVYFIVGINLERGMFGEGQNCYYHMIFSDVMASICLTLGTIGAYYFITLKLPEKVLSIIKTISRNITSTYCIHWVLVSVVVNVGIYAARGTTLMAPWQSVAVGTAISVTAMVIAHLYTKVKGRCKTNAQTKTS